MGSILVEFYNDLSRFSYNLRSSYQGQVIKWVLICYALILIANIAMLAIKHPTLWEYMVYGTKKPQPQKTKEPLQKAPATAWEQINAKLSSVNPNDWKIAVIDADKMMDEALKNFGAFGDSLGERLKSIVPGDVDGRLDEIWEAHKTRNRIVHDPSFELTNEEARKTVKILEEGVALLAKK